MARFTVSKGSFYTYQNRKFELKRKTETGWQVENTLNGVLETVTDDDFYEKYKSGAIQMDVKTSPMAKDKGKFGLMVIDIENLPPDVQETIKYKRIVVLNFLQKFGSRLSKINAAKFLGEASNWPEHLGKVVHPDTLLSWTRKFIRSDKNPMCFLKLDRLKGNRNRRIDVAVEELCIKAINEIYMTDKCGTLKETLQTAKRLIAEENRVRPKEFALNAPSINVIRRMVGEIPQLDKDTARLGRDLAMHLNRESTGTIETKRPLYRAEVDHTKLDLMIVDEETGLVIGRPWLTLIVDTDSRCVLGFYLTFDPPSHASVAKALRHAILPKSDAELREKYPNVKGSYPMHGIMEFLITDNGLEFHSEALTQASWELGIVVGHAPRKKAWWKGTIERLLGTLNRAVTGQLDGKTFASVSERKNYKSTKKAIYTLPEVEAMIMKWIIDIYHQTRHRTLGTTPARYWAKYANVEDIKLPADPSRLDSILGQISRNKRVHHYGIELNTIVYNNRALMEIRAHFGRDLKLDVRWNSDEMGWIYVYVPDGGVLKVEANNAFKEYATGITYYQHNMYRSFNEEMSNDPDTRYSEGLLNAKQEVRKIAQRKLSKGTLTSRIRAKRALSSESPDSRSLAKIEQLVTSVPEDLIPKARPKFTAVYNDRTGN